MAIVPQDVPVANEINIAIINTIRGNNAGVIQLSVTLTTYSTVPNTSVTNPIDQAKTIITNAGTIVLILPSIVSSISLKPTPLRSAIPTPTTVISSATHVNATATSISASASINDLPSSPPTVMQSPQIPTPINVTNDNIKLQMLHPSVLNGSPNSFSVEDNGLAPSAINFPVDSARCSAF